MKHKIKIIALMMFVTLGLSSCLDKYPQNAIPADKALNTFTDMNQAALGVYSGFKSPYLYSGTMVAASEIQADMFQGVNGYSNQYSDFWLWELKGNSRDIENVWGALYDIIGRCNFMLDYEQRVRNNTVDDKKLAQLDDIIAEVHFARALAYSELATRFCKAYDPETAENTPGIVWNDSYLNPKPKVRANLKASYQYILDDLEKAESLKQETAPDGAASNWFTKSAVHALYARVYLNMQDWDKAIEHSTEVINDKNLVLATTIVNNANSQAQYYPYMWSHDTSSETIWRVKFETTSYGGALGYPFVGFDFVTYKPNFVAATKVINLYGSGDGRYNLFFANVETGYTHKLTWPILLKLRGNYDFLNLRISGVSMPKVLRLSEQYLIRAEAYCKKNRFSEASADISALRAKRIQGAGALSLSASNWLDAISDERVREFIGEGFRLNDLKRWKREFERTAQPETVKAGNELKIQANNPLYVWPIPQHELNIPGSKIEPNESNR